MKLFNLNHYIYIQILDKGWAHVTEKMGVGYVEHCIKNRKQVIDGEVYYKLQCWCVFQWFPIDMASDPMIKTNILFDDKDLIEFK